MIFTRNRMLLTAGLLAASLTLPVMSDPPADGQGGGKLGGPPVNDRAQKGRDAFGKDGGKGGKAAERGGREGMERRNPAVWRSAMESVMPSLSDEQKAQIKSIRDEFEAKAKAWQDANGEKVKALQEQIRQAADKSAKDARDAGKDGKDGGQEKGGKDAGRGGKDGAPKARPQIDPALMKEMQDLKATMPNPMDMQAKAFAVLNADQQAAFKESYDKFQKEAGEKGPQRRGGKDGDPMGAKPGEGGDRPARRPASGRPFQFEENKPGDKPADNPSKNGDGKPSGK